MFPTFELLQRDAEFLCVGFLRQTSLHPQHFDLLALSAKKKEVVLIQQILHRNLKQLCQLLYMFLRIIIAARFLVMNVGTAVDTDIVRNVTLAKPLLIAIPPQLVRDFCDLSSIRILQIESLSVQQFMRKDNWKAEYLKRRNF